MTTEETEFVTCTSCKHYSRTWLDIILRMKPKFAKCRRTLDTTTKLELVTGELVTYTTSEYCDIERWRPSTNSCGQSGKFWVPKNNKDLFKLIKRI